MGKANEVALSRSIDLEEQRTRVFFGERLPGGFSLSWRISQTWRGDVGRLSFNHLEISGVHRDQRVELEFRG